MDDNSTAKTAKFTSLENLYVYSICLQKNSSSINIHTGDKIHSYKTENHQHMTVSSIIVRGWHVIIITVSVRVCLIHESWNHFH